MTRVGLFFGAGASVIAGLPTTEDIGKKFNLFHDAYDWISKSLASYDVEEILEIYQKAVDQGRELMSINEFLARLTFPTRNKKNILINQSFTEVISYMDNTIKNIFSNILPIFDIEKLVGGHVSNYRGLFDSLKQIQNNTNIYTTNYDYVIKKFVEFYNLDYEYNSGVDIEHDFIVKTPKTVQHLFLSEKHRLDLYRLHGSIKWSKSDDSDKIYEISKTNSQISNYAAVPPILGKSLKNDYPFLLPIFNEYESEIMEDDVLIIIGFSFRDDDIRKVIKKRIKANKDVIIISPSILMDASLTLFKTADKSMTDDAIKSKSRLLETQYKNLKLIDRDFGPESVDRAIKMIQKKVNTQNHG